MSDSNPETAPTGVPETTSQAAIPLPAVSPPLPAQPLPEQLDTPPAGVAQDPTATTGSTPPQGTYAMGALAGNPMLGTGPASPFGGPPTDPGCPHLVDAPSRRGPCRCGQSPGPQRPAGRRSRNRSPRRRIRHRPCHVEQRKQHPGLQPDIGQLAGALRFRFRVIRRLRLLGEPVRQRFALRRFLRRLGQFRQHRELRQHLPAPAARDRRTRRARVTPTPSPRRSTRAWSTSTPRSATSRSRLPARASCSRATASS